MGYLAESENRFLKRLLINSFIYLYKPDLGEAIHSNVDNYISYNDFFTRKLKNRDIDKSEKTFISPVDGEIVDHGYIKDKNLIQAKRYEYSLEELLGEESVDKFNEGYFVTIYLAPTDYHRIHCPYEAVIRRSIHLGSSLFSVNKKAQETIPKLYIKNERSVLHLSSNIFDYALVSVGASVVGSIVPFWGSQKTSSRNNLIREWNRGPDESESSIRKGEELAHFKMGSTVILLFEDSKKLDLDSLNQKKRVKFGAELISLKNL
jgi:phosphatidylserine decarboxylase